MPRTKLAIPVYLPDWLYMMLKGRLRIERQNLLGDRDIEWSWVAARMPSGPGEALDVGAGSSCLGLLAAQRGFNVTAVDLADVAWPYRHSRLSFIQGDILELDLPSGSFDLVVNCSTVEHIGLSGRYGVAENRPDGDLEAMTRLSQLMKQDGLMLLTVPVGRDALFEPFCRIYGEGRLPCLIRDFYVEEETFWVKDGENRWVMCDRDAALVFEARAGSANPLRSVYALGCMVLRKPALAGDGARRKQNLGLC